jgi:putative transposase
LEDTEWSITCQERIAGPGREAGLAIQHSSAMAEIPRTQRRPLATPLECYHDAIADSVTAMAAAYATGDYTMQEIATFFRVHYATVSRTVKKHEL